MLLIARRTALAAALLLVMPLTVLAFRVAVAAGTAGCHVEKPVVGDGNGDPAVGNYHSHVVLCGWFLWCLRFRLRAALILFLILAAAILAGQGAKSWVKARVQEPRPFVICLAGKHKAGAGDAILRVKA